MAPLTFSDLGPYTDPLLLVVMVTSKGGRGGSSRCAPLPLGPPHAVLHRATGRYGVELSAGGGGRAGRQGYAGPNGQVQADGPQAGGEPVADGVHSVRRWHGGAIPVWRRRP